MINGVHTSAGNIIKFKLGTTARLTNRGTSDHQMSEKDFPAQGVDLAGHGDVDRQGAGGGRRGGGGRGRRPRGQPQLAHPAGDQPRRVPLYPDDGQALEED